MATIRTALTRVLRSPQPVASSRLPRQRLSSSKAPSGDAIDELLATPSWSVRALQESSDEQRPEISPKQLHHLLRLSALPPPKSPEEEADMIETLRSQLRFVRAIQGVDTTGVPPLQGIRDETSRAEGESEITVDILKAELAREKQVGFARRIVRADDADATEAEAEHFDPLAQAPKKIGRYIVVNTKED